MRALVYKGPGNLNIDDVMVPVLGDYDVLIKVYYCGLCGTDIHIFNGEGGAFDVTPPLIMGHELSGIVDEVGGKVTKVKKGDLVSVNPNNMCGECYYCKNAMEQFCENIVGIGTTIDGGFAEYCKASEKQVFKFKEGADAVTASMAEPLSCCIHGIDLCHIKLGDEVMVIGGGPIGLIMMQLAKMAGAGKVILSEPISQKRELARRLGADIVIDPIETDVETFIRDNCKNIDVVIECVGKIQTIQNAIEWAGNQATVMMFGLTGSKETLHIKPDVVFKKELKLTSSFINPYTFERAVAVLESGRIYIKDIISDIVELEDSVKAFEDDRYRRKGKVLIKVDSTK